jgi:hypothetical protein
MPRTRPFQVSDSFATLAAIGCASSEWPQIFRLSPWVALAAARQAFQRSSVQAARAFGNIGG